MSTTSFLVLINGLCSCLFRITRYLRQGDALSLILLIIVEEGLEGFLERAYGPNLVHGFRIKGKFSITHLQCADDT